MKPYSSCILCATPRSGSTLLCDLLAGVGMGKPHSYFRQQDVLYWSELWGLDPAGCSSELDFKRAFLAAAKRTGSSQNGVFGLRIMWQTMGELRDLLTTLYPHSADDRTRMEEAFGKPLYLHLSREDKVAQAVSRLRAEQSGLWHRAADGSERERSGAPQPAKYDPKRLAALVAELETHDDAWSAYFECHGIQPVRLTYEALSADPYAVLSEIAAAFGIGQIARGDVKIGTARLADATSTDWAARFRREHLTSR